MGRILSVEVPMAGVRVRSEWYGNRVIARLQPAKRRIIRDAANDWLARAMAVVPLREGHLERSGHVEEDGEGAAVAFGTDYGLIQHEREDFRHLPGRRAKFITSTYRPSDFKISLAAGFRAFFSRAR